MFVKIYFVLLTGLFLHVQAKDINMLTPTDLYMEDCLKETGATTSQVKWLRDGHYRNTSPTVKKWVFCFLVKSGVMSSTGVLRQDVVLRDIPIKDKDMVEKTIDKCLYKEAHEPAETAWHYLSCFHSKLPKYTKDANRV